MVFLSLSPAGYQLTSLFNSGDVIFLKLAAIVGLVLLNAFFVACEFAIVKIRPSQVEALLDQKLKGAQHARHITQHLDAYLSATQLGITLASLALGWIGEPFLNSLLRPLFLCFGMGSEKLISSITFFIAFMLITSLHIVLGEQAPKTVAIRKPVPIILWCGPLLALFYGIFRPIIHLLNAASTGLLRYVFRLEPANETELVHSEEELRLILGESTKTDEVTPLGQKLALNALDLRHRVVRDIMTPRSEVILFDINKSFEEELTKVIASQHTRFPICNGELDESSGLVHIKDLLELVHARRNNLFEIQRPVLHVSEMMSLEKLLNFFLQRHAHFAIAVDEYGGTVGIVTLDNVLEELVGSIQDEFDTADEEFHRINEDEFEVVGTLALHDLADLCDLKISETEVSTVGGYVTQLLGHLPIRGEAVGVANYVATITETDGRRVLKVKFKKQASETNVQNT
jgi:CBS domain containing-hemolysin-like protein